MNQMKSNCLLLLITVLLGSCGSPEPTSSSNQLEFTATGKPIISLDESNYLEDPTGLLEEGTYITLTANGEQGTFKSIFKLLVVEDTLVVYDNLNTKIIVFDGNGGLINEISRQGKGPEEYIHINDVFYWNGINVIDPSSFQIIRYRLNGDWQSSQKYDHRLGGSTMTRNKSFYIVYRNSIDYLPTASAFNFVSVTADSLLLVDSASFIVPELAQRGVYTNSPFTHFEEEIYALPPFEDVIYRMDAKGSIDTAFVIQVPEDQQLAKDPIWLDLSLKDLAFSYAFRQSEAIKNFRTLMIQEDLIGFSFTKNKESHFCLYDRKKGTTRFFKTSLLTDDPAISLSLSAVQGEDLYFQVHSREAGKVAEYTGLDLGEDVNAVLLKTRWKK
jgi:hypothetical protein